MKHRKQYHAVTFFELLAVVSILAIIAAVIVPRVLSSTDIPVSNLDQETRSRLNFAIDRYYVDHHNTWPPELNDLVPDYFPHGVPARVDGRDWNYDHLTTDASHRVF